MTHAPHQEDVAPRTEPDGELAHEAVALVRQWLDLASREPQGASADRLSVLLRDEHGLAFAVGFVDGVIRPEDSRVAARTFATLSRQPPAFLPWHLRAALRAGGPVARVLPWLVIPVVRRVLRALVGHLLIDTRDRGLGRSLDRLNRPGQRLNVNLLGEAVLGRREADRRLVAIRRLVARPDVDYVSVKVSSIVAPHPLWAFDETVAEVVERLTPLYRLAAAGDRATFLNLDMEEYKDLDLTLAVFMAVLDQPDLLHLEGGVVLQAYLPDSMRAMERVQEWAAARRSRGGAPVKVRVVKGANLPMEQVEASLQGWPLATWSHKVETDAHYKRLLDWALRPERILNVRVGVAGHNLFDLAYAWLLAGRRNVRDGMDIEMLLGMAAHQAEVIRRETGGLILYTPVVHPDEFDVAVAYLVRRLEESASAENFMSAIGDLHTDPSLFEREQQRFLASIRALESTRGDPTPRPNRQQDRRQALAVEQPVDRAAAPFANAPDTDFALSHHHQWGRDLLARAAGSRLGVETVQAHTLDDQASLDDLLTVTHAAGRAWGALTGRQRAEVLEAAARGLESRRAELIEVMVAETHKTLDQADSEVSEAVDFAAYYAQSARELTDIDGAEFVPQPLTLVTPPWNFPVAIPAGSALAALAAGSAVVVKPAPQARRCGSVLLEALWAAGVPRDVLRLVHVEEEVLGSSLVGDDRVGRVILTGSWQTAELFRSIRPDLRLLAETSGKNAIIVTPSADLDLAAADVARSAFGHAGQKCSAASLVIMVGPVGRSERFTRQLVDAVTSLRIGPASAPTTQLGPLTEPASGKLLAALTVTDPGESWLLEPRCLDDEGQLWSPGIRLGVARGSAFHRTEYFGPVLGLMQARDLDEAIAIQNEVDFGLTAGLHSRDRAEISTWLDRVEAGNLYVNRSTTGAIVRRQPFGGWKRSSVGTGTKAGGPDHLLALGDWRSAPSRSMAPIGADARTLLDACGTILTTEQRLSVTRGMGSDAQAWSSHYGVARDVSGLAAERNVLRHLPTDVCVRLAEGGRVDHLLRVAAAARRCRAAVDVSVSSPLPESVERLVQAWGWTTRVESDRALALRLENGPAVRVRLLGGDSSALARATGGRPDVAIHDRPVTESGRLELLPFLREQAISVTAHRFGTPDRLVDGLFDAHPSVAHQITTTEH